MKNTIFFVLGVAFVVLLGFSVSPEESPAAEIYIDDIDTPDISYYNIEEENITDLVVEKDVDSHSVAGEVREVPRGRWAWAKVTAYTPGPESCGPYADGFTSVGVNTRSIDPNNIYGLAADPRDIPYGTAVFIPEYWEMLQNNFTSVPSRMTEIDDTGGAMRQFRPHYRNIRNQRVYIEFHIDVRFRQVSTCRRWGVKYLRIFIYED